MVDVKLQSVDFSASNLSEANLSNSNLFFAECYNSNFNKANLRNTNLWCSHLDWANFDDCDLREASFMEANLSGATFRRSNLEGASLVAARLVKTDFQDANMNNCFVHGVSVWNVNLKGCSQTNLTITRDDEPTITIDNLEISQFIYLLLHNEKIRGVIDTMGRKAVLILGRFKPDRKVILDAIKDELRNLNYVPILFDFDKPITLDLTETIVTLAHLSRFVIADLTEPSSIPHELMSFVRDLPSVPVQPIILRDQKPYAMLEHLHHYHWFLPTYEYESQQQLLSELRDRIILPAERKVNEIRPEL